MQQLKTGLNPKKTNRGETNTYQKYINDIVKIPKISPEEEAELARKIHSGDQKALDKLVKANLRFVVSVAKQYQNQGMLLPDLINEGNFGLIKAAQRFDETKGFKFISYGVWWARQAILAALAEQSRIVRIPAPVVSVFTHADQMSLKFAQTNEREATLDELADMMEMSTKRISLLMKTNMRPVQLDAPVDESDPDSKKKGDILLHCVPEIIEEMDTASFKKEVREILTRRLTPKQADVLISIFKIDGDESITREQIVEKYKLKSILSIQGVKEKAIKRLRQMPEAKRIFGIMSKKEVRA